MQQPLSYNYTEEEVEAELRKLYATKNLILYSIDVYSDSIDKIRNKTSQKYKDERAQLYARLSDLYQDLEEHDALVQHFEGLEEYYAEIQFQREDTYPYDD